MTVGMTRRVRAMRTRWQRAMATQVSNMRRDLMAIANNLNQVTF